MIKYKITNITNSLDKRNMNFNSILSVIYVDNMENKNVKIKPNESIYVNVNTLPISIQRLRIKNLVSVVEVDDNEFNDVKIKPSVNHTGDVNKNRKHIETNTKLNIDSSHQRRKGKKDDTRLNADE